MKTTRIRTELSGATFVFILFTEVKTNTETTETNTKTDIAGNRYRSNTARNGTERRYLSEPRDPLNHIRKLKQNDKHVNFIR